MTIQDWSGQRASNIASEICGFLTVLAGTVVLHSTREPDQTVSAGRSLFSLAEPGRQVYCPNYPHYLFCLLPQTCMHHSRQKYTGISKGTAMLGSKERMTPLHANSSLLCGKTTLCRDHPGCLVLHVFFLRPSAAVEDRIWCAPIDTRSKQFQNFVEIATSTLFPSQCPQYLLPNNLASSLTMPCKIL